MDQSNIIFRPGVVYKKYFLVTPRIVFPAVITQPGKDMQALFEKQLIKATDIRTIVGFTYLQRDRPGSL